MFSYEVFCDAVNQRSYSTSKSDQCTYFDTTGTNVCYIFFSAVLFFRFNFLLRTYLFDSVDNFLLSCFMLRVMLTMYFCFGPHYCPFDGDLGG